jgi:uncharacterized protein (DUF1684 family)
MKGCAMTASKGYVEQIRHWRAERLARLAADDGWLNLIGRWDLEPGTTTIGSAADSGIVLPAGPGRLGAVTQNPGGDVVFAPADGGETIRIVPDRKVPPRFDVGRFLFEIMTVGDRLSLRARDREHPARASFPGIDYFDIDEAWRVVAEWIPLDQPFEDEVETMVGTVNLVTVTHKAAFTHDGVRYELLPSYGTPQSPQFVIRDKTAPAETYPASRFVYGEGIGDGAIVLDFNKAINPPCAFTDFAVCPLPPPQNVLPFRIPAGELKLRH